MKTIIKLSDYTNKGYSGIDCNPEISLFEYGLLCKEAEDNSLHCVYGIGSNNGEIYDSFDSGYITGQEINELPFDLNSFESFFSYIGSDRQEWLNDTCYISKLHSLLSYFGYENIFGSCYESFEVNNE